MSVSQSFRGTPTRLTGGKRRSRPMCGGVVVVQAPRGCGSRKLKKFLWGHSVFLLASSPTTRGVAWSVPRARTRAEQCHKPRCRYLLGLRNLLTRVRAATLIFPSWERRLAIFSRLGAQTARFFTVCRASFALPGARCSSDFSTASGSSSLSSLVAQL